jgi:hypothetical protein
MAEQSTRTEKYEYKVYDSQCTSHFIIRPYRTKRLDNFCRQMSSDNPDICFDDNVAAVLRDQGYSWDETPRSIYKVDKLYAALDKYAPGRIPDVPLTPEMEQGIAFARACFGRKSHEEKLQILPFNMQTVVRCTSNPTGSAGLTAWGCKKADAMLRALERGQQVLQGEKKPEPCISFKRTQFNDKTRLVWGYPYAMTVIEGMVAKPLIELFKGKTGSPMAFGMSSMKLGSKLRSSARHNRYAYSTDMSSFDASISARLIRISFGILKSWYDLDSVEPESGKTVREVFDIIEGYFIHTPIVMPDHHIYYGKRHGVPSGSYFTQMIDSVANTIIAGTIAAHFNMYLDKHDTYVLGDDLLMWSDRNLTLEAIANYASRTFGVEFNAKKSTKSLWNEPVHYLGRVWDQGHPDQEMEQIIARMVYPEQFRVYSRDPEKRDREVDLLLAAMAGSYRSAHRIVRAKLRGPDTYRLSPVYVDANIFDGDEEVQPEHLSGLTRFKLKYMSDKHRSTTSIAKMYLS